MDLFVKWSKHSTFSKISSDYNNIVFPNVTENERQTTFYSNKNPASISSSAMMECTRNFINTKQMNVQCLCMFISSVRHRICRMHQESGNQHAYEMWSIIIRSKGFLCGAINLFVLFICWTTKTEISINICLIYIIWKYNEQEQSC